jgi:hypothetical protein
MNQDEIKRRVVSNAEEISRLHARIHETLHRRSDSPEQWHEWEQVCQEFRARYDQLAFPGGGYASAVQRILAGDRLAVEAALCFLELRPHFSGSGCMRKVILRKIKQAPLSLSQAERLRTILQMQSEWRARKHSA